ncbi:MAG: response regulator [Bacteroidetes bacterium]|nr:response regulator [Bacteroidota bacterium]
MEKSNAQKTFGTLKGKKILIVDDEQLNQLVIKNMIKLWGAECETAEEGNSAFKKIFDNNYDIILMDLMMPGLDGYQTAQKIRKEINPPKNQVPILALTGSTSGASIEKLSESGINDFAAKPFKIEELHAKITKLIFGVESKTDIQVSSDQDFINLDYLKESAGNNPSLIKDIINIFLDQTPGFISQIEDAVKSENWEDAKTFAHKMKPTVSYVGISSLVEIIKNIEDYSEEKIHLEKIPGLVKDLKTGCQTAFIELKKELLRIQ